MSLAQFSGYPRVFPSSVMLAENNNLIAWSSAYPCNDMLGGTMYFIVLVKLEEIRPSQLPCGTENILIFQYLAANAQPYSKVTSLVHKHFSFKHKNTALTEKLTFNTLQ